jgi:hypothetical protein
VTLLGVTDRAYLTVEEACRYAIGDPANPLLTLNAVDANGVLWACEEPPGGARPAPRPRSTASNTGTARSPATPT